MTRRQVQHANQLGVTSYPYVHSANAAGGEIVPGSVNLCSYLDRQKITKELMVEQGRTSVEAIEVLDRPLPTSWLPTYLPDWLVLTLFKRTGLFDQLVVERHGEIRHINEYNGPKARLELKSDRFASKNITVSVSAPLSAADRLKNFRCFVIRRTSVSEIHPQVEIEGSRRIWTVYVSSLSQETLRLQWSVGLPIAVSAASTTTTQAGWSGSDVINAAISVLESLRSR